MASEDRLAEQLTIAEVAELTGLTAHTLRYYERIGLLDPVARGPGNARRYDAGDLAWLAFLQRLRATGMAIRDMQHFAALRRDGDGSVQRAARCSRGTATRCSSASPNCMGTSRP